MSWNPARALSRPESRVPAVQDVVCMVDRQRQLALVVFLAIFGFAMVYGLLLSDRYEARMEILVEQAQLRRADPVMTGDPNAQPIVNQQSTTSDEILNSEIALLRSQDVLRQVVTKCGLDQKPGLWFGFVDTLWRAAGYLHMGGALNAVATYLPMLQKPSQDALTEKAVSRLAGKLQIEVIKLSDVISITYRSSNPQQAAAVLHALGDVYLNEHVLAHRPAGELEFFEKQTAQAHDVLAAAEQKLVSFTQNGGVANGETQLQDALKRLSDTKAAQDQTQAEIAATQYSVNALENQASKIPPRETTVLKSSDSALLLQQLKSSLLDLEMKRTQLLTQYQPTYPLVVEVNQQIAQAQAALADAQKSQVEEKTTDRDPNYEQVQENLTRSRVDLAGLRARAMSLASEYAADQQQVRWLEQQGMSQQDLLRQQKTAEDNYLLLLHKAQEARISEALDKRRIFNVSIVQTASVPALPVHPAWWYVLYGGLLSVLIAFAAAAGADRMDPTLRTSDEVEGILQTPVLVILPLAPAVPNLIEDGRRLSSRPNMTLLKLT